MEYNDAVNDEKISAIKAQRGIENMEELYRQLQEAEDDGEEGEGEGEAEAEGAGEEAAKEENQENGENKEE
jgi:hypothetical protein